MKSIVQIILMTLMISACDEQEFQGKRQVVERETNDSNTQESPAVSEPVMIGGAFLACLPQEPRGDGNEHYHCRLEHEGKEFQVPEFYLTEFRAVDPNGSEETIFHEPLAKELEWTWHVAWRGEAPVDQIVLLLKIPVGETEQVTNRFPYVIPPKEPVPEEAPPPEPAKFAQGDGPQILGGGNLLNFIDSFNEDCQLFAPPSEFENLNSLEEVVYNMEILENQTIVSFMIPKICGSNGDNNEAVITYPDGTMETLPIPEATLSLEILRDKPVNAGKLVIVLKSGRFAGQLDDMVVWGPKLTTSRPIKIIP